MRFITLNGIPVNVDHIVKIEHVNINDEYNEIYIVDSLGHKHQYYPTSPRDDITNIMNEVINFINGGSYNLSASN